MEVQYKLVSSLIQTLKAEVLWIFAYTEWIVVKGAMDKETGLGTAFNISLLLVFGTIGVYLWRAFRTR